MKNFFVFWGKTIQAVLFLNRTITSKRAIFLGAISLIILSQVPLQAGTIKGKIFDKETNEELPAANVVIKGTSFGAAANLKGEYTIPNTPPGNYTLEVTYIGYAQMSIDVTIPLKGTITQDFALEPVAIEGKMVVVTAQAQGQIQAINQQLTSNKIANIVSEARIQELPDFNAAEALSRLPGVSTLQSSGEANKIVIRGLAPKYNSVQVEGVKLASTGSTSIGVSSLSSVGGTVTNDRSVDISMVSPYMLKSIQVYKSLTPDMNANSIGGTVNMELREAPSEFHADAMWQSGYTEKSNTYGNFRAVASASNRFFNDKLGAYLLVNAEKYDRDADNMNASYTTRSTEIGENGFPPVTVRTVELDRHLETRQRFGGNLILDYRLPSGSIKAINMYTRLNSDFEDHRMQMNYSDGNIRFNYRGGDNDIDLTVNSLSLNYDFRKFTMDLKASYTTSKNNLPEEPLIRFYQNNAIATNNVKDNTIPDSLTQFIAYRGSDNTYLSDISLFSTEYQEKNQAYKADFKVPFNVGFDISGFIKFGGEFRYEDHKNDQATPFVELKQGGGDTTQINPQMMQKIVQLYGVTFDSTIGLFQASKFMSTDSDLYKDFLDDKFGNFLYAVDPSILTDMAHYLSKSEEFQGRASAERGSGGYFNGLYQQIANDYTYNENYWASYIMSELNLKDIMLVGGVRYENDESEYSAVNMEDSRNPQNQPYYPITSKPKNDFFLPMVQVKYNLKEWGDVRYAYTQSLARPDYHQLSPKHSISYDGGSIWAGNPDLVPAEAYNHDLIFSFHSNKLGLFTLGGFFKTIKDFTYYTQYKIHETSPAPDIKNIHDFYPAPKDGATLYTYMNSPFDAYVKGLEVDFQTSLWYMPFPLNGVVIGTNYTHIKSEATYPWRDEYSILNPDFPGPGQPRRLTVFLDSTRTGRLINQPNDILNTYIGFDYKGFSARVSFIFQGNSVSYVGAFAQQDGFTKDYFRIDASARQQLPWEGSELYLNLNNINNEDNTSAQRSIGGFTNIQNYGLTANIGIRFRI